MQVGQAGKAGDAGHVISLIGESQRVNACELNWG